MYFYTYKYETCIYFEIICIQYVIYSIFSGEVCIDTSVFTYDALEILEVSLIPYLGTTVSYDLNQDEVVVLRYGENLEFKLPAQE